MTEKEGPRHSALGIVSLVLAVSSIVYALIGLLGPSSSIRIGSPFIWWFSILIILPASLLRSFIGMIMGGIGIIKRDGKRLFPVLGLVLNVLSFIGTIVITIFSVILLTLACVYGC